MSRDLQQRRQEVAEKARCLELATVQTAEVTGELRRARAGLQRFQSRSEALALQVEQLKSRLEKGELHTIEFSATPVGSSEETRAEAERSARLALERRVASETALAASRHRVESALDKAGRADAEAAGLRGELDRQRTTINTQIEQSRRRVIRAEAEVAKLTRQLEAERVRRSMSGIWSNMKFLFYRQVDLP
ncbi:unnamed protein product [Protopolystoma xenopodis]|uniref:Uncharacterized protein n=1 Tax=Protopolystoma xenopodis TaxID=117903 RepID=A0A3S5AQL6_9PLAT|nr:unnamed protein product [Protopolystoma xenopodis]